MKNSLKNFFKRVDGFIIRVVISKVPPVLASMLYNLRGALYRLDNHCEYDKKKYIFLVKYNDRVIWFKNQRQNMRHYAIGVEKRAKQIGEVYFLNHINFKDGDVFVDCGANVGDLNLYFRSIGVNVNYIGFEPSQEEYECLKLNVAPSITYNVGLWYEDTTLEFFLSSDAADSSIFEPQQYRSKALVKVKRLDQMCSGPIKCLKVEAEGAEPEVLLGCDSLLSQIEFITADLGFERGVKAESTIAPVANYLLNRGFELVLVGNPRLTYLFKNKNMSTV